MPAVKLNTETTDVTFLDDEKNPPYKESDVVMLGVACDLTASYNKGAWHGPHAILNASHQVEYETPGFHIPLTDRVKIHNAGILECPKSVDARGKPIRYTREQMTRWMNEMVAQTRRIATDALDAGKTLMLFGGDHSVPNGVWDAMLRYQPAVTILHFDGHLDLRHKLNGQIYSHACIMRRARDSGFRVLQVGPRDHISGEEAEYIREKKLADDIYFCATQPEEFYQDHKRDSKVTVDANLIRNGAPNLAQMTALEAKIAESKHLWISIDVDGLDASHIPGTGTPLPMGLSREGMRRTIYRAIETARRHKVHIAGFDINEVAPQLKKEASLDISGLIHAVARLLKEKGSFDADEIAQQFTKILPYSAMNTVSTMSEMDAALLAYNMLFWTYIDRFTGK